MSGKGWSVDKGPNPNVVVESLFFSHKGSEAFVWAGSTKLGFLSCGTRSLNNVLVTTQALPRVGMWVSRYGGWFSLSKGKGGGD